MVVTAWLLTGRGVCSSLPPDGDQSQATGVLGPISLTIFPSQFKCDGNFILLSSKFWWYDRYKISHMPQQRSYYIKIWMRANEISITFELWCKIVSKTAPLVAASHCSTMPILRPKLRSKIGKPQIVSRLRRQLRPRNSEYPDLWQKWVVWVPDVRNYRMPNHVSVYHE